MNTQSRLETLMAETGSTVMVYICIPKISEALLGRYHKTPSCPSTPLCPSLKVSHISLILPHLATPSCPRLGHDGAIEEKIKICNKIRITNLRVLVLSYIYVGSISEFMMNFSISFRLSFMTYGRMKLSTPSCPGLPMW